MTQVQAELDAIGARLAKEFPAENGGWTIRMVPLQQTMVGNVKSALLVLLGAVGLVLLIACANIANLLLTRATARAREITVRATLGAGRARIVRQLLNETAVLGLLGGVTGIGLLYLNLTRYRRPCRSRLFANGPTEKSGIAFLTAKRSHENHCQKS